jgi:hypothetical protein
MVSLKDSSVKRGTAIVTWQNGNIDIRIRTRPLPKSVTEYLMKHAHSLKHFALDRRARIEDDEDLHSQSVYMEKQLSLNEFKKALEELFAAEGGEWKGIVDR